MAVTAFWFGKAFANIMGGETAGESSNLDWLSDTIKVMLTTSTYVPNQDTNEFKSDVTNEVSGTGYSAGGVTLTTKTLVYTGASNLTTMDADDAIWSGASFTARIAVIYKDTGTGTTSNLLGYVDFGADQTVAAATFTIQWNASGIFTITVS